MTPLLPLLAATASAGTWPLVPMHIAGDSGQKLDIVIVSEGYSSAQMSDFADDAQRVVDALVGDCILASRCPVAESGSAFNVWRLEVASNDGSVTDGYIGLDKQFHRGTAFFDTAFRIATNNSNPSCWFTKLEGGSDVAGVLALEAPLWDAAIVLLNTDVFGACNGGTIITATNALAPTVYLHEFGHNLGGLGDEYVTASVAKAYAADDKDASRAAAPNLTTNPTREGAKWNQFIAPSTAVPGTPGTTAVSLFEGGAMTYATGVWRPTEDSTMNNNTADYGPVGYHRMMQSAFPYTGGHPFRDAILGDFFAGNNEDLVVHQGVSLLSYLSLGAIWSGTSVSNTRIPAWDYYAEHDRFTVGDFDGDEHDDLFVFNPVDYDIPYAGILTSDGQGRFDMTVRFDDILGGWGDLAPGDRFTVGDFDGDGADDLLITNATDWGGTEYAALALSRDGGFRVDTVYADWLPNWVMSAGDVFHAADVDGDGDDEVVVSNFTSWQTGYVGVFQVSGSGLVAGARYDGDIDGWGGYAPGDQVRFADFDGDGADDLVLFNPADWDVPYLGLFRAVGGGFQFSARYDGAVDGWDLLAKGDHFVVGDTDDDGCEDLVAWNTADWGDDYVGVLASDCAGGLAGSWQTTDELGFGAAPALELRPAFVSSVYRRGVVGVVDDRTLVRLRSDGRSFTKVAGYLDFVHEYPYHASGWW